MPKGGDTDRLSTARHEKLSKIVAYNHACRYTILVVTALDRRMLPWPAVAHHLWSLISPPMRGRPCTAGSARQRWRQAWHAGDA
jgi:hypothetical protein